MKDLEATLPLLDSQQLVEDDERENQFILNYVTKAKKFLDHDKVMEMVSVLTKYKDNVKEVSYNNITNYIIILVIYIITMITSPVFQSITPHLFFPKIP